MDQPRKPASIVRKLVGTLVLFGASFTILTLLAAQVVRLTLDRGQARQTMVVREAQEIMALTSTAAEESFSYVILAEPSEKRQAIEKLAAAHDRAVALASQPDMSPERRQALTRVFGALEQQRLAAEAMFASFDSTHEVSRDHYDAFERCIDESSALIRSLDETIIDDQQHALASVRGRYASSMLGVGLAAMVLAIVVGRLVGRRIARPLVELREAVTAYGEGRVAAVSHATSNDEVGQLADAFHRMVDERAQLDEELREARKIEAIGRVAGGVAHDFNNVLAAVLAYTDLALVDLGADHPVAQDLRDAVDAARRGVAMTKQLLDFSRRHESSPRVVSVNDVVIGIRPMLARLAGKGIALEVSLDPSSPTILMDPSHLDQVLMNLVVNAHDAMPQGGTLRMQTRVEAERVVLLVADTGVGMAPETAKRIFEPFFTTKGPGKGTGLGLATVARVVREARGTIGVQSEVGRGSVFEVTLPVSMGANAGPTRRPRSKRPSSSSASVPAAAG